VMYEPLDRRTFMLRCAKMGLASAAALGLGFSLHDPAGPAPFANEGQGDRVPDFRVPGIEPRLVVVKGQDRAKSLRAGMSAIGGINGFVKPGDRVAVKVNAAFASPPALGATTHPELVSELIRICLSAGARSVTIIDNPINDPFTCFELSGIAGAARSAGGQVILPESNAFRPVTVEGGSLIRRWPVLIDPLHGVNKLIGAAPVKDHHRSGASMAMKNWYGLLGGRRSLFHQEIHTIIQELAQMVRPTLVILDGTVTMIKNGPTGGSFSDLKRTDTLIISNDQVAADAYGATLLNKTAADLPFIRKAAQAGLGNADYRAINLIETSAT
jgi:uncharacterized protein (DUF362 family)